MSIPFHARFAGAVDFWKSYVIDFLHFLKTWGASMGIEALREPEEFQLVLSSSERERLQEFFMNIGIQQQQEDEAILAYGKVLNRKKAKRAKAK